MTQLQIILRCQHHLDQLDSYFNRHIEVWQKKAQPLKTSRCETQENEERALTAMSAPECETDSEFIGFPFRTLESMPFQIPISILKNFDLDCIIISNILVFHF